MKPNIAEAKSKVSLTIPSDARYLKVLRSVVESVGRLNNLSQRDEQSILLASSEACANIIEHSYKNKRGGSICLTLGVSRDKLQIELEDEGIPIQREKIQSRSLDDVKPGGLGVHLIRSLVDEVIFDTEQKNRNRLILIKERRRSDDRAD